MRPAMLVLSLLAASSAVFAQSFTTLEEKMSVAEFRAAGLEKLSAEELAALNAWLQARGMQAATTAAPAASSDRRGFRQTSSDSDDRPVISRLPGTFRGWSGSHTFELENGQVWRTTESSELAGVTLENPRVRIERGFMGVWRLKVEGYNTSVKVERVR